jgi:glucose 1-dehydrogenase
MRLDDKMVLISGAGQGIGRAVALRLASEGADIALNVLHDDERAAGVRTEIEALGRRCAVLQGDVSQVAEVKAVVAEGVRRLGRLDVLVNNAGVEKRADFLDMSEAHYDHVMGVNLKGAFFLTQAFVAHLKETQRPGKVINMSSVHEELPFPHFTAYCCSKGGMRMLMRNLAVELAPLGITVNNIAPGAIETPINAALLNRPAQLERLLGNIPLRRLGQPGDVAGVAAFLASAEADYITGATLVVDGGLLWNYSEQ